MSEDIHKYPSQLADRFQVRMPEGLRDRIREAADANSRSMNAEIVATLEKAYPAPKNEKLEGLLDIMERLSKQERQELIKKLSQATPLPRRG